MPQNTPQPYSGGGTYGYQVPYNPYMSQTQQMPQTQMPAYSVQPQPMQPQTSQQLLVPPMPSGLQLSIEKSTIEKILHLNRGKIATVYMTFENNPEWNAKVFKGIIEEAGRDHLIISDPTTGVRYLLPTINFDYATFDEPLEYNLPFAGNSTISPG